MSDNTISRRRFVKDLALAGGAMLVGGRAAGAGERRNRDRLHVACNSYSWFVFYRRENRNFYEELDTGLGELAASRLDGYEPGANNPKELDRLRPLLKKHDLEMRSLYVNSVLHEPDKAERSIESVLAIAEKAKTLGTKIIVTNPSPISWGGAQNKGDAQLETQAAALNKLGRQLRAMGLTLAYHNHDIELRNAAREFHHMMV
ncbi:MAG: TIM barrel protein, partial [Phycisphaerales bacterium]